MFRALWSWNFGQKWHFFGYVDFLITGARVFNFAKDQGHFGNKSRLFWNYHSVKQPNLHQILNKIGGKGVNIKWWKLPPAYSLGSSGRFKKKFNFIFGKNSEDSQINPNSNLYRQGKTFTAVCMNHSYENQHLIGLANS